MTRHVHVVVFFVFLAISGCATQPVSPPKLIDQKFSENYEIIFQDRVLAPNLTSKYSIPEDVVGIIWFKKAKEGKQCSSSDPNDFNLQQSWELKTAGCEVKRIEPKFINSTFVKGGLSTSLKIVVGEAATNDEYAFEINTAEPGGAVAKNVHKCLDFANIKEIVLPTNTCSVMYTTGVVQTHFLYKTYRKYSGNLGSTFGIVTVGGQSYANYENSMNMFILSIDTIDISHLFPSLRSLSRLVKKQKIFEKASNGDAPQYGQSIVNVPDVLNDGNFAYTPNSDLMIGTKTSDSDRKILRHLFSE